MLTGKIHTSHDDLLLKQLAEGSNHAFDLLYDKYWCEVVNEANKRLGDKNAAKDVAQEVFTILWARKSEVPLKNLHAWLYTVTKNQVYKLFHKQSRFVPITDILSELKISANGADAIILEKELIDSYKAFIATLPDQQRIIFKLRYQEELNPNEIALKLELSSKTVRNHLGRALLKVKTTFMFFQLLFHFIG
jgi:RNA polymerase sigma-70 factor (ECF subfamily)